MEVAEINDAEVKREIDSPASIAALDDANDSLQAVLCTPTPLMIVDGYP